MRIRLFRRDVFSGSILIVFSLLLWFQTLSFPELENGYPGPALFPQLIAGCLGILGAYLVARSVFSKTSLRPDANKSSRGKVLRLFTGIILVATYPLFVHHIHFIPIMAGLIFFFGVILNNKPWKAMLTAVFSAGLIYALFTKLLGVPL